MTYILAIILICIALPYIGRLALRIVQWWIARKVVRMQRRAFEQAFGGASSASAGRQRRQEPPRGPERSDSRRHRQGKRIDPGVGEYVDYEEIIDTEASSRQTDTSAREEFSGAESRIVDVEWEDVK